MMDESRIERHGGFSLVKSILSDALPAAALHPDFQIATPTSTAVRQKRKRMVRRNEAFERMVESVAKETSGKAFLPAPRVRT